MIEINLVPDVKQELIRAQRARASVISIAILVGIAAIAVVVILAVWVFAIQTARGVLSDNTIRDQSQKLAQVPDINNTLTIQNQLAKISQMHDSKNIDSRVFDILNTINPPAPNDVALTSVLLDSETKTIKIEAQAVGGYQALEVFKKTIDATKLQFTRDGQVESVPLSSNMSYTDPSYGENADGKKVLRFTISFTYPDELFSKLATGAKIIAPSKTNVTDSFVGVPKSLFTSKASDLGGEN